MSITVTAVLTELATIAQAWRSQQADALREGRAEVARDCRLRASAIEWATESLEQQEREQRAS